jgi:hypothetical protein
MPPVTGGNNGALIDWNIGLRHRWAELREDFWAVSEYIFCRTLKLFPRWNVCRASAVFQAKTATDTPRSLE